jgi:YbgC/YbaW family acyl-CoA thioester hydrolase
MRWADMDLQGHVNNVIYVDYLQEARVDMLRVHAAREGTDQLAEALVVVHHEVHYRAPLTYQFQPVSIECWVTDIRAASFTMAYEVFHEDEAGINAPEPSKPALEPDLVITPLLGFDRQGRRLGQGGGYYDRALEALRACKNVFMLGLGYVGQETHGLPVEAHDQRLDAILTESEYIAVQED